MAEEVQVAEVIKPEDVQSNIGFLSNPDAQERVVYFSRPEPDPKSPTYEDEKVDYLADVLHMQSKADFKSASSVNERINLVHVMAHRVRIRNVDEKTGEVTYVPADRVVMLDDEGRTFECVSGGLMQSLLTIFQIVGQPSTWKKPLPITIKSVDVRSQWHTLKLEIWKEKKDKK